MADYVLFGHGRRGEGTSTGTYVVPPCCTIHFFEKDGQLLNTDGATVILDWLLRDHPEMASVNSEVVESFGPYDVIPDYQFTGDVQAAQICDVSGTGLFRVGQSKLVPPAVPFATGVNRRISQIIGSKKMAFGTNIYWVCCRATKVDSNKPTDRITSTTVSSGQSKAREKIARDTGLKPSEVIAKGRTWR